MAKFRSQKNSFIAGEISPTAMGRTDLPQYLHACKTLRNVIPFPSGGVYRRPGTKLEAALSASTDHVPRLLPFIYSNSETYCLYIGRTYGGSGYLKGFVASSNTTTASSFTASGTHSYEVATLATAAAEGIIYDETHDIQYCQSADIMYLVHPKRKPMRIYRTAAATFRIAEFDRDSSGTRLTGTSFREAWPYLPQNSTAITLSINTATVGTGRTLTASAAFFDSTHVGAVFKVNNGGTYGCCLVTGYTNSTNVTVEVIVAFGAAGTPVTTWWESAWSSYRGWPRTVCFFQQRLCYGGSTYNPDSLWFSQTSNYNVLSGDSFADPRSTPTGAQPFTAELSSLQLNQIQWLSSEKTLVAGTSGDEFVISMRDETSTAGFARDNFYAVAQSHYGSSYHQAVRIGKELVFSTGPDQELKSIVFNEVEQAYVDESIQLLFDDYPKVAPTSSYQFGTKKYRGFTWDRSRKTLWCHDTAGSLFAMTRDRQLQVTAWHTHRMGGYDSTISGGSLGTALGLDLSYDPAYYTCTGSVLSVTVVPNRVLGTDDVWLVVKRKVNGSWFYHIERMIGGVHPSDTSYVLNSTGNANAFADSCLIKQNTGGTLVENVGGHLNAVVPVGTACSATYGIWKITGSSVSGGNTTIQSPVPTNFSSSIYWMAMGYGFDSIIEPVRVEAGSQIGSSQGAVKRIHEVSVRFFKTLSAKVGGSSGNTESINFRAVGLSASLSAELYTGDKVVKVDADYDRDGYLYILQDEPMPFAVMSISATGMTYD